MSIILEGMVASVLTAVLGLFSPSTIVIEQPEPQMFSLDQNEYGDKIPTPTTKYEVERFIRAVAIENGINEDLFAQTAWCESRFNVQAINEMDTDGKRHFFLWQYDTDTWAWANGFYGTDEDIADWRAQTQMTANLWNDGYQVKWGCWHMAIKNDPRIPAVEY